jgi:hypothetical protein
MDEAEYRNAERVLRDHWPTEERVELGRLAEEHPAEALVVADLVALLDARPVT